MTARLNGTEPEICAHAMKALADGSRVRVAARAVAAATVGAKEWVARAAE